MDFASRLLEGPIITRTGVVNPSLPSVGDLSSSRGAPPPSSGHGRSNSLGSRPGFHADSGPTGNSDSGVVSAGGRGKKSPLPGNPGPQSRGIAALRLSDWFSQKIFRAVHEIGYTVLSRNLG